LRYRTYPYEIFGLARGTVSSVSHTAILARDTDVGPTLAAADPSEPLFRVTVDLPAQFLETRGLRYPLRGGMLVDADLLVERKRLYQWIIDPLYGAASTL
jgi:membrane fusion protein